MRQQALSLLLLFSLLPARGQTGGDNTYEFLNLSHSAFATATGGITVSQGRNDLSLPLFQSSPPQLPDGQPDLALVFQHTLPESNTVMPHMQLTVIPGGLLPED